MQRGVAMVEQAHSNLSNERTRVRAERDNLQAQLDEASRLKGVLQKQQEARMAASSPFACCVAAPTEQEVESEQRRAVRKVADRAAAKAFVSVAKAGGVRDLTVEDLREIEGDDAEAVMKAADKAGTGTITLKQYRKFKRHQALEKMSLKRYGKALAEGDALEDNEEDWMCDASYSVGQEVQVLRSDGSWEVCEILIVDRSSIEPFYVVQLMNGMTKEVDENMLWLEK
mmetsp:Transcript_58961/g.156902  ORF Transcript_58961/g.156902 Transcript_58961/m.156902 type:complete len:228 (-) Transcript_58961:88-771(-)